MRFRSTLYTYQLRSSATAHCVEGVFLFASDFDKVLRNPDPTLSSQHAFRCNACRQQRNRSPDGADASSELQQPDGLRE